MYKKIEPLQKDIFDRFKGSLYGQAIGDALGLGTEDKGVSFTNIARHFKMWAMDEPLGIGENTYKVLNIADYVEKPFDVSRMVWKMSRCQSAANGGLMRTSVVGLFPKCVTECAENICKLTHYDPRCVGSCVIVSSLINALVYGARCLTIRT